MTELRGHLLTKFGDVRITSFDTLRLARMYLMAIELDLNGADGLPDWMKLLSAYAKRQKVR